MNRPDIESLEKRLEAATPGPWESVPPISEGSSADGSQSWSASEGRLINGPPQTVEDIALSKRWFRRKEDGDFIAHAREDIPALIAYVKELAAEIERMRPLYELYTGKPAQTASLAVPVNPNCTVCGGKMSLRFWDWPGGPPGNGYTCDTCHPPAHAGQEKSNG
jgi:hypothetical protein